VVLHVGAPKTGTTYLQSRLTANLRQLHRHDVHVPHRYPVVAPELFHFRAALDLVGEDWGGRASDASGSWDQLVAKVRRAGDGTVLVSHEILAPAAPDVVARAKRDLLGPGGADELHVVCTVRDLARQVPAAWQEAVKQGYQRSYGRFCKAFVRGRQWWARALDLPSVLATWGAGLPPEHVHVVTVPPRGARPATGPGSDPLWERFAAACGLDPAWAPRPGEGRNVSLGISETQLIRRLNRNLDAEARRDSHFDKLVREMLAQESLVGRRRATPVTLPPSLHPWVEERAEQWIEWVQGAGVHVVGDLADLRPAPLAPDAADTWADPDHGRPREQLSVAVAALAVMTQEAARRSDPDLGRIAKTRRQVGRMRGRG